MGFIRGIIIPKAADGEATTPAESGAEIVVHQPSTDSDGAAAASPKSGSSPSRTSPTRTGPTNKKGAAASATTSPAGDGDENEDAAVDAAGENGETPANDGPASAGGGGDGDNDNDNEGGEASSSPAPPKKVKLYKSPRFKGYLTIFLASTINYNGTLISQRPSDLSVVVPSDKQVAYGKAVAMVSALVSGFCVLCHLDSFSCFKDVWRGKLFAPQARFEAVLDCLTLLWWAIATIIQTG
jgi:hypothetical protein